MTGKSVKEIFPALRADINAALAEVAKKHNLSKLIAGNATYIGGSFTIKLEGLLAGADDKDAVAYDEFRSALNLPERKSRFSANGADYTITGLKGTKVIADRADGKRFTFKTGYIDLLVKAAQIQPPAAS